MMLRFLGKNPYIDINTIGLPKTTANVGEVLIKVTQLLMTLVGMLAVIFILVGAIQYSYSRGNPKNTQTARETILYACVGLVVAIAALAIVTFISSRI